MFRRILKLFFWLLLVGILTAIFFLGIANITSQPVIAAIAQIEESPGQMLYRSEQTLKDQAGNTWQVIVFKQVYPDQQMTALNLRLMGLSSSAEIVHPKSLKITTKTGKTYTAPDIFLEQAPLPSIGQYDLKNIVPELPTEQLTLDLPLSIKQSIHLQVPKAVVQEWQEVATRTSSRNSEFRIRNSEVGIRSYNFSPLPPCLLVN